MQKVKQEKLINLFKIKDREAFASLFSFERILYEILY